MTGTAKLDRQTRRLSVPRAAAGCLIFFMLALILRNSEAAISFMRRGLRLCAETVIPSLFPFMVISELLVASGAGEFVGRLFSRPMQKLFGVSGASVCAILLGALCGFPIGAKTAVALYDRGAIDRDELERLLTFCNNTSSAFLISAVGASLWSSRRFGVGLYCIQLGAAALIGLVGRRRQRDTTPIVQTPPPLTGGMTIFTRAVASSATGMLVVCAYVTFFSSVIGALGVVLDGISPSPILDALLFGFFELSSGVSAAASLDNPIVGALLTAFTAGWSGLSVHFQIMSLTDGRGISHRPYLIAKAVQGLLCTAATALWLWLAPPVDLAASAAADVFYQLPDAYLHGIQLAFGASVLLAFGLWLYGRAKKFGKIR